LRRLIVILLFSTELFALPEGEQAAAGHVDFSRDGRSLKITASDQAIINYQKFNIGEGEHVQFIQPSSKASVLNRIKGGDPSKILGKLSANGRVFLVNPSGIYFGPHATVNTGSFVASTLNIRDEDFLKGRLHFFQEPGSEKATIVNEGMISASPEGFVALFAPFIENRGSIFAQAGKVVLAAAERVTLDFMGDGLIQFTVDGDLKEALIENYGKIEAAGGAVEISLHAAKKAIKMVVNTDGITPANEIEEIDGVIHLVNTGALLANTVHVDGSRIDVQGTIDVSSENAQGGTVHLLGDQIQLRGVKINASGALGGGNVLVGGDYQGKGELHAAQNTVMDGASQINADAYLMGNGGKVILWADDTTLFDGKITARGGAEGGNGGFVETSGKRELGIQTGHVDTSAKQGKFGNWLLDPSSITIATGGGATIAACSSPNCGDNTTQSIDPATIGASATNVALCAQNSTSSSITVTNAVTMANPGVSLTLTAGSTNVGTINLNNSITTKGGAINLTGVVALGANATLDTTNAGATPAGAAISLSNTVNGARTLNLNGGTGGTVTMTGAIGGNTTLTSLTATGATVTQSSTARTTGAISYTGTTAINLGDNIRTSGAVTFTGPVIPSGTPLIDATNNGGSPAGNNISFSSTINGATSLTFRAGTSGIVTFSGAVGNTAPLTNLIFNSANLVRIANNITVTGGNSLVFSSPVSLTGTSNITSNNANITFSSTLNGAQALTLIGGSGTVTFTGAVGGTAPLTNIVFTSANLIQIGNSLTVSGANPLLFPSPVSLTGTSSINSNNANITFNSTLNGAQALTVTGGSGTTTFTGAVGGTTPLTSLSAAAATITQSSTAKTTGALSYTGSTAINIPNNITTSGGIVTMTGPVSVSGNPTIDTTNGGGTAAGANISFSSTLNGATVLTLLAGTGGNVAFSGAVGNTAPLTNLALTSANLIQIGNNITVSGANPLIFPSPVSLTGTSTINSNNANITLNSTLNGAQTFTATGGSGTTTFTGAVGGTTPLTSLSATAATITQTSTAKTTGALSYTGSSAINVGSGITTSGGGISLTGPVTLNGNVIADTTNSGGSPAGANINLTSSVNGGNSLTLTGGTGGTVSFGTVGGTTPLTSLTASGATIHQNSTVKTTGAVSYTGSTAVNIPNNVTTSGGIITMAGPVAISNNPTIDTTNAGGTAAGANISFSGSLNGATALTLLAGTGGNITLSAAIGNTAPLTNLLFTSSNLIQVGNNITVTGANPVIFPTPVSLTGTSVINSNNALITFNTTLDGAQALTLTGGSGTTTFTGAVGGTTPLASLSATAATIAQSLAASTTGVLSYTGPTAINLGGNITTSGGAITLTGPVAFTGNFIADTTNGGSTPAGASISLTSTVNGGNSLTLTGGTGGTVSFGAAGGVTPLTALTASGAIIHQNSTVKTTGAVSYTGATAITIAGNITTSGGSVTMAGPVAISNSPTIDTTNGGATPAGANINFSSTLNGATALTLVGGTGGNLILSGAVGNTAPLTNLLLTSANLIQIGSSITVSGANPLIFPSPVSLTGTSTITSNNANITFNSTLDGAQALTILGGIGTTTFTAAVGGITPLTSLSVTAGALLQSSTVHATGGVAYNTGSASINGNITTGGGAIAITGPVVTTATLFDTTNGGASPTGADITFSSTFDAATALTFTGGIGGNILFGGAVGGITPLASLTATGLTVTQNSTAKTTGALSYTGTTAINVKGNITTSGAPIGMNGPVVLSNSPTWDTTNGGSAAAGANISFSSTLNGAASLTLRAGTAGNTLFSGAVGGINPLTNLSFTSVNLIQIGSDITVTGASPLTFISPVQLTGTSHITSNNGNILFNSTVDDSVALSHTLRLIAGSGSITLSGAVGGTTPLGALAITSATNVTANGITVGALSQGAGSGTTTFNGAVVTSNGLGIDLSGSAFTFNSTVTTTGGGGMTIANSGLLSMPSGSNFTLSGPFSQTGLGAVRSGNTITSDDNILFAGPVALTHAASFNTSAANHQINFNSTIDSLSTTPFDLTLAAGTSNITILGNMGSIHPLGALLVSSAGNLTIQGLTANSATINGGTGTATVNGDILIGSGGVNIVGNNFVNNGNVVTTSGGSITINNSGTVTRSPGHTTVVDGNYSVIGTGPAFAGSSLTVRGNVLINPAVTLLTDAIVDTSAGGGNITFASTINATHALTLKSGTGNILISGNIGSGVPIGNFTISSANNVTAQGIQAASFTQTTGTGTTALNGPLITSGALGISIHTNTIIRGAAITTTGGGPLTITNSGAFTSTAAGAINLGGAFTQNGTGAVSLAGTITTTDANLSFASPIAMGGNVSLNTGTSMGNITLSQTVQGAFDLAFNSGGGSITLGGGIGTALTPLTAFTITNAGDVSTQAIFSSFITQAHGSGTTTFNGALNTTSLAGISLTGTAFTFNSPFTTATGGPVAITHTGLTTFNAGATGSISGALTQTGVGGVRLSSTITSGGAMQFSGPFSVSGTGSLSTEAANQPITFFSTLNGPGNLTLSSGSADILIAGNAGALSPLGNLVLSTVRNFTTEALAASSITQSSVVGAGTTLFNGDLVTSGSGIQLTGSIFTFLGNATANNTGSIAIANTGALTTAPGTILSGAGGFSQTGAGIVSLGSGISATNANISFASPITLTSNVVLNSGTTAGDITVGTVDGNFNLTFTAGRDIFAGVIGGTTRVGTVTATTVRDNHASDITAAAIVQLAGTGTTSLVGSIDTNTPAGINLVGTNFSRSGDIITTNSGSFAVTNSGSITGTSINMTSIDGSYTQIGVGPLATNSLAGTITARLGISLSSPTTLISDPLNMTPIILDSSGGNGDIVVTGTLNNNIQAPHTLILRSGSGDVMLSGSIGNTAPIGPLILGNIQDLTAAAITAASISQETLATIPGQATFNGAISTSGSSGIALAGNAFAFNNNVTTTGGGTVVLENSGLLAISSGSAFTVDGSFTQTGAGSVSLGGSIATTNDAISFAAPLTLTAPASLNTGAGAGDITLSGALNGPSTLSLAAGTGNIDFQSAIGPTVPVGGLTVSSASNVLVNSNAMLSGPLIFTSSTLGSQTFNGTLVASAVSLTGGAINFNNAVTTASGSIAIANSGTLTVASMSRVISSTSWTQTGAGAVSLGSNITTAGTLSMASPVTLTQNIALNSGNGNITLSSTVAGVFDLSLTAGSGDITLAGNMGAPRLGAVTITSANNISAQAITAASLKLLSAIGTSTLHGSVDTNALAGITLIGNNFTSSGSFTTTNGGPFLLTNSGLVTATGASAITLNGGGAFTQNGTGPVNLGGTLTTQNANISHSSPVTVLLPTTMTSNNGNIVFQNTIDGPACLTLVAGAGDVTLNGAVGGATALGCLNASGATVFQNQSVRTTGVVQETATGSIRVGGNITTTGSDITLTGNTTITASSTLSTSGGAGNISITGTVNGNVAGRNFMIQTGTGDVTLAGAIGGSTPFNNLTISGNNITWANLGSTVLGATGITSITAATDLTFTGTSYINGTQVYTAGGNFNFTAGAPTAIDSNALPITFNTGTIQLGGTDLSIMSNGGNITLTPLLGAGRNLVADAENGALTFIQIGAMGQDLNNVLLTSDAFSPTPVLDSNVFASSLTVNSSAPLVISTDQSINAVTYNSRVIFQGNITYSCGAGGTIIFNNRVDANTAGIDTLTFNFNPCSGSVTFNQPVGSVAPLASITIDSATDVTVNSTMNVGSLPITNGAGTVAINSGITSTAAGGINIESPEINMAGSITTASGGPLVLNNSGALTIAPGTSFDISGPFQQTGAGSVSIGGSVVTHDADIQFTGPTTLSSPTSLNSHVLAGGNISFAGTLQGAQTLTLDAGSGDIQFNGVVGTLAIPLNDIQIDSAHHVTASSAMFAATLTQLAGTGLTSFSALQTTDLNGINLSGNGFTFNSNVTTGAGGPILINNAGSLTFTNTVYSIAGGLTQSGLGSTWVAGSFTTGGAISFAAPVILSDTTSLNTSASSQNITFHSTLTNDMLGPHDLTLNAGTGNITCAGAIGAAQIGALTISSVGNASFNAISAASLLQSAGTGTTAISGNISTSGGSGIHLTGTNFNINGTVATAAAGPFSIINTGPLSLTLGNSTLIDGSFSQSGGGAVTLSGTVATNNQNISFANGITLAGTASLSSGSGLGAGSITLSSAVNGNHPFTLNAGTGGDIILGANLGAATPLGALTVSSVRNITYPLTHAASIVQGASPGTTIITGPFNTTALLGVSIAGSAISQNGAITTTNAGPAAFMNTGALTVGIGVNTVANEAYSQSGGGTVSLGGSVTSGSTVSFNGAVALTADVAVMSGTTSNNGNSISFASAVTGAHALTLTAEGGQINFDADIGTIGTPLTALTITHAEDVATQGIFANTVTQLVGTGLTTFHGALNAGTGISLTGVDITFESAVTSGGSLILAHTGMAVFEAGATGSIAGALAQSGTGGIQLSSTITAGGPVAFTGPFSVIGSGSLNTQAANQPIRFFNTVDGPGNLTLAAGTADITFDLSAGDLSRLGALNITSALNLTAQSIKAASIQTANSGLALFNGDLNTNGASGISLAGAQLAFSGNLTTTGGGPITLSNTGALITASGKAFTSDGAFTQNGSGSVLLGSTIMTTNATAVNAGINFSGTRPITLIAPALFDSSMGGGTINFSAASTVNGPQPITWAAGTGDINILGDFGTATRLGALTITSGHDIQLQAITANSIKQVNGSGTTTLLGALDTDTPAGMTFIGNNFTTGAAAMSVMATNGGSLTITNQGVSIGNAPVVVTLDGEFIQNGPGPIFIGSVTARQGISLTGPAILGADATLDTSSGNGDITFSNIVSGVAGTENLTLNAGTGNITLSQPLGLTTNIVGAVFPVTALGSITAHGEIISINDIGTSLAAGVTGPTSLTAMDHLIFTGTTYHANTQTYTGTATFQMNGGALTTFTSNGNPLSFIGSGIALSTGTDLTINTGGTNLTLGTIHAQPGNHRHLVLNAGAGSIQVGDLGTQGQGEFASASFTANNLTLGHEYANAFTFNYTGTLNVTGDIVSTDSPLIFSHPVVLQTTNVFSTVGTTGADITFSSTLNGAVSDAFGLTLNAGSGNILFSNNVGVPNRLLSLTIGSAGGVTLAPLASMRTDALVQLAGSGTTTFNGPLIVPGVLGILLTGNNFTFHSTVNTANNASLTIANSGTLNFAGTASLSGAFTQNTPAGSVTLSGSITAGQPISFSGPVTLLGTPSLNTATANQSIIFLNTVSGSGNLTLAAGNGGDITFNANIGSAVSPVGALTINSSHTIGAQSLFAQSLHLVSSSGLMTVNGTLQTNGAAGMNLFGHSFTLNGALTTTGGGSVVITNSGLLTGAASIRTVDGSYTQNGTGSVDFAGTLTTLNGPISFASLVNLLGPSVFDSSAASQNVTFSSTVDGPSSLSVNAGGGDVVFAQAVGANQALSAFTVTSAHDISVNRVGTTASGVLGTLDLSASHDINLPGTTYSADAQSYAAGHQINLTGGAQTTLASFGGPVAFTSGIAQLSSGTDLLVLTHNGAFSFDSLLGTNSEQIIINTGTGAAALSTISSLGTITNLIVDGGNITFSGTIHASNIDFEAFTAISNAGAPVLIQTPDSIFFNAHGGNIGSLPSPILVQTLGQIFAGADGSPDSLADFDGSSSDNTIHPIPSNSPCKIIFNNVVIKDCTIPPVPPVPPTPARKHKKRHSFPFAVPGFDSSFFNLASDYFFLPYFLDDRYVRKEIAIYYRS